VKRVPFVSLLLAFACTTMIAHAQQTPGYPERVLQWTVQPGETCADIATSLYGSARHADLLLRYNTVRCGPEALPTGVTLVVPEKVAALPTAMLKTMKPDVRARPPAGAWSPASPGMPLHRRYGVNTMDTGRADIRFVDRTRVFLAENTLVVIFGTAGQTHVSKTPPARVQLEEGEMQAGLAALRGDAVEVDVEGGGRVSAQSRDTVVKKKTERTTVSVFDGSARVQSGGAAVDVPQRMGSSFVRAKPPSPPRPLPAAPAWAIPTTNGVVLAPEGSGVLHASWAAVARTKVYRFEVARDRDFTDLVVREEVPKDILAFRAEKLPSGSYYLRVRAIDDEDFLGLAATAREVFLLDARLQEAAGEVRPDEVVVHPYGVLAFAPNPQLEMAVDEGPFGPIVTSLDFRKQSPKRIRLRPRGSQEVRDVQVRYIETSATIRVGHANTAGGMPVHVQLHGFDGVDVASRVAPVLRVRGDGEPTVLPLVGSSESPTQLTATVPASATTRTRLDVMDGRGLVLGTEVVNPAVTGGLAIGKSPAAPGITAAPFALSHAVGLAWWGPGAPSSAQIGGAIAVPRDGPIGQVHAAAVGRYGPLALEARLASDTLGTASTVGADAAGWAGLRWTAVGFLPENKIAVEPSLRVALPMAASGPGTRVESAIAVGAVAGRFTWAADLGLRMRTDESAQRTPVPATHAFLLAGGTYDTAPWLRLFGVVDAHLLDDAGPIGRTGLSFGGETTGPLFGSLGLRASPWDDAGGIVAGHLAVGFRDL
jgi:hypothetical protein